MLQSIYITKLRSVKTLNSLIMTKGGEGRRIKLHHAEMALIMRLCYSLSAPHVDSLSAYHFLLFK